MKIFKKIIKIIFTPFRYLASYDLGTKIEKFFAHHPFMYYLLAGIGTLFLLFMIYLFPQLR